MLWVTALCKHMAYGACNCIIKMLSKNIFAFSCKHYFVIIDFVATKNSLLGKIFFLFISCFYRGKLQHLSTVIIFSNYQ